MNLGGNKKKELQGGTRETDKQRVRKIERKKERDREGGGNERKGGKE